MLSDEEAAFVNDVRAPLQRALLAAVSREYHALGWPIVVLTLVEVLGGAMDGVLKVQPKYREQFLGHLDTLRLRIEAFGEREH